jgi:site-specific DNA-methyltransferase (adenine-specific)
MDNISTIEKPNPTLTILNDDCLKALKTLPDNSVQCCVTSPPYYGLRSYLKSDDPAKAAEIGAEQTPDAYVKTMVEVFREVKRVLKEDGVLWLNLGDSYNAAGRVGHGTRIGYKQQTNRASSVGADSARANAEGLKPKDLLMIPARVAIALQADGWYLRAACPWIKRNGMPESVKDRPSQTIETLYMLTKSERYHYDAEAVKVNASNNSHSASTATAAKRPNRDDPNSQQRHRASGEQTGGKRTRRSGDWFFESWQGMLQDEEGDPLAFIVNTKPYKGAHFAVFPATLIEPCVKSCARAGDTVLDPFGGSGTTAAVALQHGCSAVVCELNADYVPLIRERCVPFLSETP